MSPTNVRSAAWTAASSRPLGVGGGDHLALGVVGGGGHPQPDGGGVRLLGEHQVAEQPGGPVDPEHQHAGGHRVERAGVADLAGAGQPPHLRDDVVRRHPAGLVHHDQPGRPVHVRGHVVVVEVVLDGLLAGLAVGVGLAGVRRPRAGRGDLLVGLPGLGQQLVEVPGVLRQRVVDELQRRHVPQPELLADLGADQPLGGLERRRRGGHLRLLAEDRVEHRRLLRVAGDPDVGDGDEPEPRVLDPPLQHLRHDDLDPVRDLPHPWAGHGSS